ncbi:MAG: TIGR00730 family Rossman fold protein [Betaproteobacteria bacterium]|nr:TIGR00730 family Rossman fold protein [Betaproteobacteria bacterium]
MRSVCVFCGSSPGGDPVYVETARETGRVLAEAGVGITYGGGRIGMMGAVADGALAAGGRVVGVIPEPLEKREVAHDGLTELHVVDSMHRRKQLMADLSDAFVMLPGGFGTLEEFCEIVTWSQLGMHGKPCVLVNVRSYFGPLVAMFDHALAEGFVRPVHRDIVCEIARPAELLDALRTYRPPQVERWLTSGAT